jgi:hypothetical protein
MAQWDKQLSSDSQGKDNGNNTSHRAYPLN